MKMVESLLSISASRIRAALCISLLALSGVVFAELPQATQAQVDDALQQLAKWAADPAMVGAVSSANAAGDSGMTNGRWVELGADSGEVRAITSTQTSEQLQQWKQSAGLNKLFLRAKNGTLVAGSQKPLVYNVSKRPPFKKAIAGSTWHAGKAKPDPTTQKKVVQISVPVKDAGGVIGVLHSAVQVN